MIKKKPIQFQVYPIEVRSGAAGVSSAIGYFVGFLSNKFFLGMVDAFTLNGTFWLYSAVAIIGCITLYFTLPETENKTLEEIQSFFNKSKSEQQHDRNDIKTSTQTNNGQECLDA